MLWWLVFQWTFWTQIWPQATAPILSHPILEQSIKHSVCKLGKCFKRSLASSSVSRRNPDNVRWIRSCQNERKAERDEVHSTRTWSNMAIAVARNDHQSNTLAVCARVDSPRLEAKHTPKIWVRQSLIYIHIYAYVRDRSMRRHRASFLRSVRTWHKMKWPDADEFWGKSVKCEVIQDPYTTKVELRQTWDGGG